jgi:hypothetical protein
LAPPVSPTHPPPTPLPSCARTEWDTQVVSEAIDIHDRVLRSCMAKFFGYEVSSPAARPALMGGRMGGRP